jgi:hypothetical protein
MTMTYATARATIRRVREEKGSGADGLTPTESRRSRFPLGKLYATPGALSALAEIGVSQKPLSVQFADDQANAMTLALPYMRRHACGDWGDVDAEDAEANAEALECGSRLLSAYQLESGERLWIITEADRSSTTILLSGEY